MSWLVRFMSTLPVSHPHPSVWYSIIDINIYIYFSVAICDTSSYTWILYFIHSICVSCTLWRCSFRYVKVDVSRVLSLFKKNPWKKTKSCSMKLLSVTTQSCNPVLVPETSVSRDARKSIFLCFHRHGVCGGGSGYTYKGLQIVSLRLWIYLIF